MLKQRPLLRRVAFIQEPASLGRPRKLHQSAFGEGVLRSVLRILGHSHLSSLEKMGNERQTSKHNAKSKDVNAEEVELHHIQPLHRGEVESEELGPSAGSTSMLLPST